MKGQKYKSNMRNLPPGVTVSDIEKHFGPPRCEYCKHDPADPHEYGCPKVRDYCGVCDPPPEYYRTMMNKIPLCEEHSAEDYKEHIESQPTETMSVEDWNNR